MMIKITLFFYNRDLLNTPSKRRKNGPSSSQRKKKKRRKKRPQLPKVEKQPLLPEETERKNEFFDSKSQTTES